MTPAAALEEGNLSQRTLRISPDLKLPLDAVTQTFAILARKRSGKSYTARRLCEQMSSAGLQIVAVDPKGDWWGIRSSADGKGAGLPIVILGGERGDVPLEVGGGELVAKLVVEEQASVLLDLSLFRKHEVSTFVTAFAENLYRLKAREQFRTPLMLFIDEADAVAPQKPQKGEERMLGAIEDIVRRGGQRGIGCTVVTQRSAVLNKNVLTQAQVMVALRTIAPQDLAAMDAWIDVHGTVEQRKTLMESLPSLPRGDAWFWSPGWPTDEGIFKRVHVDPIETFDSGATPKPGEKRVEPKRRADVDLEVLRRQMAETVERAKASDPKLLRRRVAELEAQLAKGRWVTGAAAKGLNAKDARIAELTEKLKAGPKRVEVPVLKDGQIERLAKLVERMGDVADKLATGAGGLRELAGEIVASVKRTTAPPQSPATRPMPTVVRVPPPERPRRRRSIDPAAAEGLGRGEIRILAASAQHPDGVTREQLTVLTGYTRSSRNTYIQRLRAAGLVEDGDRIRVTQAGLDLLGPNFEPLPTGPALLEHVKRTLPQGERVILEVVVAAYPNGVDKERISETTGYTRSSRNTYLQRLRARELITEPSRDQVRASETLFLGGAQ